MEDLSQYILPAAKIKDMIFWKMRCKKELEDMEFEAMMLRKYATKKFYQTCRNMTIEQMNERLWRLCEILIPWYKKDIDDTDRALYLNNIAREEAQSSMKPFEGLDLTQHQLQQKELF